MDNLKQQDPTLQLPVASEQSEDSIDASLAQTSIENRGITEMSRLVDGLTRAVVSARERVTPLSQQLAPLRLKLSELKEERDIAQQVTFFFLN